MRLLRHRSRVTLQDGGHLKRAHDAEHDCQSFRGSDRLNSALNHRQWHRLEIVLEPLVNFVRRHQQRMNKNIRRIPNRMNQAMKSYEWPGNVRELANVVERAVILTQGETLMVDETFARSRDPAAVKPKVEDLHDVERAHIIDVLDRCGWKVKGRGNAAERLGLNPSTLRARMKKLGVERPQS